MPARRAFHIAMCLDLECNFAVFMPKAEFCPCLCHVRLYPAHRHVSNRVPGCPVNASNLCLLDAPSISLCALTWNAISLFLCLTLNFVRVCVMSAFTPRTAMCLIVCLGVW